MDTLLDAGLGLQQTDARRITEARQKIENARTGDEIAARDAATEFESIFIAQMLEHMFQDVGQDNMFSGGHSESVYRSMLNTEYAGEITRRGGIGIADTVYREILKLQEM